MSQIHLRVASVLIWWGTNSAAEDGAFAMVTVVSSTMQSFTRPESTWQEWTDEVCAAVGIPPRSSPFWKKLGKIFDRPWHSRLWIVQEVSLAKFESTNVLCGIVTLAWKDIIFRKVGICGKYSGILLGLHCGIISRVLLGSIRLGAGSDTVDEMDSHSDRYRYEPLDKMRNSFGKLRCEDGRFGVSRTGYDSDLGELKVLGDRRRMAKAKTGGL